MVLFVCCENMSCVIKNILEVDKHTLLLSASFFCLSFLNRLTFVWLVHEHVCAGGSEVDGVDVGGVGRRP